MSPVSHDLSPKTDLGSPMADSIEKAIARGIAIPYASSGRVCRNYAINVGAGISADIKMKRQDDDVHVEGYIPDSVRLNIAGTQGKSRVIEAKIETEEESMGENDTFALSVRVREITDTRRLMLNDGTRIHQAITIGQDFYRAPKESAQFNPHVTRNVTTIVKRLQNPPMYKDQPIEVYFPWEGYDEDASLESPNAVLYEKHARLFGKEQEYWTRTYLFIDKNGRVERPVYDEAFVGKGEPKLKVRSADVSPDEMTDIKQIMTAAGTLGSNDTSLTSLIGEEIEYDKEFAAKIGKEDKRMRTQTWDDVEEETEFIGEGRADENS